MHLDKAVEKLEVAWGDEAGFLFLLRVGEFDSTRAEGLMALLAEIELDDGALLDRRAVSLLWYWTGLHQATSKSWTGSRPL